MTEIRANLWETSTVVVVRRLCAFKEFEMAGLPRGICLVFAGITIAMLTASPAIAEPRTFSCEGERHISGNATPWTWDFDIDLVEGTITIAALQVRRTSVVITEKAVDFKRGPTGAPTLSGHIDRISGAMKVEINSFTDPAGFVGAVTGRCRQTIFWD